MFDCNVLSFWPHLFSWLTFGNWSTMAASPHLLQKVTNLWLASVSIYQKPGKETADTTIIFHRLKTRMYFNSQRQEAISPIYPRSSQRCRGLSAGNKEIREVMQSLTLPAYHMSSSSSSLSPPPTKSCHKEHPI